MILYKRKNIKLSDIAKEIEVSVPMVSQWFNGKKNLLPEKERKLTRFIDSE